jgi:hypothetical protein
MGHLLCGSLWLGERVDAQSGEACDARPRWRSSPCLLEESPDQTLTAMADDPASQHQQVRVGSRLGG